MIAIVNWSNVAVVTVAVCAVITLFFTIASRQFGRWSRELGSRLDKQDKAIETTTTAQIVTATSVARIEGFMAATAGKPFEPQKQGARR